MGVEPPSMRTISQSVSARLAVLAILLCPAARLVGGDWSAVISNVAEPRLASGQRASALKSGPPEFENGRILFRFKSEETSAAKVFLATDRNNWAQNRGGRVDNQRFAMERTEDGVFYRYEPVMSARPLAYRYVVEDEDGDQHWVADPHVSGRDREGNAVFQWHLSGEKAATAVNRSGHRAPVVQSATNHNVRPVRVRFAPGEPIVLEAAPDRLKAASIRRLRLRDALGAVRWEGAPRMTRSGQLEVPGMMEPGGFRLEYATAGEQTFVEAARLISVTADPAADIRYGFYASFAKADEVFSGQARLLADAHVNVVEFYDYFPAHGDYGPQSGEYVFEPFGNRILANNVSGKIKAGRNEGILSLAYIAAYAASESVYRRFPHPMTNRAGEPLVFNGRILSETEADAAGADKWFWLMDVSEGSPWHTHILQDLASALTGDSETGFAAFDGFEIDTYGNLSGDRFYAEGSERSGDLLGEVLRDFVAEVAALTRQVQPGGLVSFNCVDEFGVEFMYAVTDFLFMEIWRGHTEWLSELTDICRFHGAASGNRVVLKLYPVDMEAPEESWPPKVLARVLGASMTGGGSLMVAGEPNAERNRLHGLRSLYYPDHQSLSEAAQSVLKAYYRHDALLYGFTHGEGVFPVELGAGLPRTIVRSVASPSKRTLCLQLLHFGDEARWSVAPAEVPAHPAPTLSFVLPGGEEPESVLYASPDLPGYSVPRPVRFERDGRRIHIELPELRIHGTILLRYKNQ